MAINLEPKVTNLKVFQGCVIMDNTVIVISMNKNKKRVYSYKILEEEIF